MTNTNLLGTWTLTVADSKSATPTFPLKTPTGDSTTVVIQQDRITVNGNQLTLLGTPLIAFSSFYKQAEFIYRDSVGREHSAYLHFFIGTTNSAIIGGSTAGDPDTVAVWGGDG